MLLYFHKTSRSSAEVCIVCKRTIYSPITRTYSRSWSSLRCTPNDAISLLTQHAQEGRCPGAFYACSAAAYAVDTQYCTIYSDGCLVVRALQQVVPVRRELGLKKNDYNDDENRKIAYGILAWRTDGTYILDIIL